MYFSKTRKPNTRSEISATMDNVDSSLQEVCSDMSESFMIASDELRETLHGSTSIEQGSDADMNASESSDSNQDGLICDPCKEEEKQLKARGFCVVCSEYLCDDCCDIHKKQKMLKTHTIRNVKDMPLNESNNMGKDVCVDICPVHSEKVTEFFCKTCDQLGCSVCMVTGHRGCSQVCYIPDIARDEACDNKCDDLKQTLKSLLKQLSRQRIMYKVNVSKNERLRQNAQQKLQKQQNDITELLAQIFKTEQDKIDNMHDESDKQMKVCYSQIDSVTNTFNTLTSDIQMKQTADQRCRLFIAMKLAEKEMNEHKDTMTEIESNNNVLKYEYQPNQKILETFKNEDLIGTVNLVKSKLEFTFEYVSHIPLKSLEGIYSHPTGLCMLTEQVLVYIDGDGTNLIQVVDVIRGNIESVTEVSVTEMASQMGDVARIDSEKFSVTFPDRQKIKMYALSNDKTVTKLKSLAVVGHCYGIDHSEGRLFVSYIRRDKRVEILDMEGKVLKCFRTDSEGNTLFTYPRYIVYNPNLQVMYISDYRRKTVTSLTPDGEVMAVYQNELDGPKGLCVDRYGCLFICDIGLSIDSIHQVTETMTTLNILKDCDILRGLGCIAYCGKTDRLFITSFVKDDRYTVINIYAVKRGENPHSSQIDLGDI